MEDAKLAFTSISSKLVFENLPDKLAAVWPSFVRIRNAEMSWKIPSKNETEDELIEKNPKKFEK